MAEDFKVKTGFWAVDRLSKTVNKMRKGMARFASSGARHMRKLNKSVSKVSGALTKGLRLGLYGVATAVGAVGLAVSKLMGYFSMVEDAEAAFTPVLKSAEKAKLMVEALNKTAASTPFQFETLSSAAQQLLPNMGGDIEETIRRIRMLGDTAGGSASQMSSIVRGYNKVLLKGKGDMESLQMIAEAGVPIFKALGDKMGVSGEKLFKSISKGKVSVEVLNEVFKGMTSKGGIYFRGMEIASETLTGRVSTLKDEVGQTAATLGSTLAPQIKKAVDYMISLAREGKAWVDANKDLIKTKVETTIKYIADNMGRMLKFGKKIVVLVGIFYGITTAIKALNVVMALFNAIMMANPLMLIVVGVALALAAIYLFRDEIDAVMFKIFDAIAAAGSAIAGYFRGLWDDLKAGISHVWEFYKLGIEAVVAIFTGEWDVAGEKLMKMWANIKTAAAVAFDWILQKIKPVLDAASWVGDKLTSGGEGSSASGRPSPAALGVPMLTPAPAFQPSFSGSPRVQTSESRSSEYTEVTLKDETGRAQVTKGGKSRGFNLVHSGGMP